MKNRWTAVALAATLALPAWGAGAKPLIGEAEIDQAAIAKLSSLYGIRSKVIAHVDLAQPFGTRSQWTLVIAKQADEESKVMDGAGDPEGAVSVCFVENTNANCSDAPFLEKYREQKITLPAGQRPFYKLFAAQVVHSGPAETAPLLSLKTCTLHGGNGSCGIATFLFAYDHKANAFRNVFFNLTGSNNNQATRFFESGPLLGDVVVNYPTPDAPFTYFVEVHKRNAAGDYVQVLKYRGKTGYGDGNPRSVIDSEMPEILRRLGTAKTGDALPDKLLSAMQAVPNLKREQNVDAVIRELKSEDAIPRRPQRVDYTDFYPIRKGAKVFGHDLILVEHEHFIEYGGCCVSEGGGFAVRVNGDQARLEEFAKANKCRIHEFKDADEFRKTASVAFPLPEGHYAEVSCRARDEDQ